MKNTSLHSAWWKTLHVVSPTVKSFHTSTEIERRKMVNSLPVKMALYPGSLCIVMIFQVSLWTSDLDDLSTVDFVALTIRSRKASRYLRDHWKVTFVVGSYLSSLSTLTSFYNKKMPINAHFFLKIFYKFRRETNCVKIYLTATSIIGAINSARRTRIAWTYFNYFNNLILLLCFTWNTSADAQTLAKQ